MRASRAPTVDAMADTLPFDLLGDTQPIELPTSWDVFETADAEWFDEGERQAEREWAEVRANSTKCHGVSLALAVAGSAALAVVLAVAF